MDLVTRLIELATALDRREAFGADEVLPYAVEAINLVKAHPERAREFEQEFLRMPAYAPPEFIEVCMHALRLPGVKAAFKAAQSAAIAAHDWRREPVYRGYLEAFEDDWENATDLYSTYFRKSDPG